jgi:hypothetical protein
MFKAIKNLWRQAIPDNLKGSTVPYLEYFNISDDFTLKWAKVISESPSATSCLSTLSDFIEGFGFSDKDLEKRIINTKGENLFQLHQKTTHELAQNEGFFWLTRYNLLGKVTSLEVLPYENCRLGKPDSNGFISKIYYNPFFGTEYYLSNKAQTIEYDVYNPKGVLTQIKEQKDKFKGQVFFYGTSTSLSRFYPIHEAYAAVKWMKIEAGVSDYHEDNINNGFLQPFLLVMKGDPNAASNNPTYDNENKTGKEIITVAQEFDEVIKNNFMGAKRVGNMFVQWVNGTDEKPEVVTIPSNNGGEVFITLDNQATKKITVAFKVPAILANIQEGVSLGGDGNQIMVAVKLMQHRVIKKQRALTDSYESILKMMDTPYMDTITIVPYNPYPNLVSLDDKIWAAMTPEEQRKWIQDNTEVELQTEEQVIQPTPPGAIKNAIPINFPEDVRKKVKSTLEYYDKMQLSCSGKASLDVSNQIVNNATMGLRQMKRIHSYLKKRAEMANMPNMNGCEVVQYNLWGGKPMFDFLDGEMQKFESWLN